MRLLQLVFLFVIAASTSASIGPLVGIAGGVATVGTSIAKLGAAFVPGLLLPLAMVAPLKILLATKALAFLKLKALKWKAPLVVPVAAGFTGKLALSHMKAHIVKTVSQAKTAFLDVPLKLTAMKVGAIHGAFAGGKAGLVGYRALSKSRFEHPDIIPASALLNQPMSEPMPQSEPQEPKYGHKTPAYSPPAPAYSPPAPAYSPPAPAYSPPAPAYSPAATEEVPAPAYGPAPESHYRKRRETEAEEELAYEEVATQAFDIIQSRDTDHCTRRSICAIAVQPTLAKNYGDDVLTTINELREDASAPWYPYKQAVATGKGMKSHEACAKEYPTCTKNIEALLEEAVRELEH